MFLRSEWSQDFGTNRPIWVFPKIGEKPQNGWFIINGKPLFLMDDLGGTPPIFGNTHIHINCVLQTTPPKSIVLAMGLGQVGSVGCFPINAQPSIHQNTPIASLEAWSAASGHKVQELMASWTEQMGYFFGDLFSLEFGEFEGWFWVGLGWFWLV